MNVHLDVALIERVIGYVLTCTVIVLIIAVQLLAVALIGWIFMQLLNFAKDIFEELNDYLSDWHNALEAKKAAVNTATDQHEQENAGESSEP